MEFNKLSQIWSRMRHRLDLTEYIDVKQAATDIRNNIAFKGPNIHILFCAIVIASVGLNVNSVAVIIGAMLISPLMSPIVGVGLALGTNDLYLLKNSLKNLGIMVGISLFASTLYFLVTPLDLEHPTELLARTNPTIYDVLIALFGGFAGIIATSRKEQQSNVIVGVAIATALMPPLCTVGYGLATLQPEFFLGALYLFFINSVFIALAAFLGTKYIGYEQVVDANPQLERKRKIAITIGLIIIILPSIWSGIVVIQDNNFTRNANSFISENKSIGKSYVYDSKVHTDTKQIELFIAGEELAAEDYNVLYTKAEKYGLTHSQLTIHQDAAYASVSEMDVWKEIMHSNEDKLAAHKQEIASLTLTNDSLRQVIAQSTLPSEHITNEITIQYPAIQNVILAANGEGSNRLIVAILTGTNGDKPLSAEQLATLTAWLRVRLETENVMVVQQ